MGRFLSPALQAVVVACGLLWAGMAQAVTVSGLYSVDVPVEGADAEDLRAGYADGLRRVMVRVSGSRDVLDLEGVDGVLENAESLLQSYELTRDDGQNRLQMTFGAVGVNKALASIDAPVWGANRPLTLAWVAVEERGSRHLITSPADDAVSSWRRSLLSAAAQRGLPVDFPPRAFAGNREVLSDLWGQFIGRIRDASEEQSRDALALVRIRQSGGEWRASWTFDGTAMDDRERSITANSERALAEALIDRWAEGYASRYSVAASDVGESPRVDIVLEGVSALSDYGRVTEALESFSPVNSVGASRVRGERLTVQVSFTGELEQLKQYVALDPRFVAMEKPSEPAGSSSDGDQSDASDNNTQGQDSSDEKKAESSDIDNPLAYQPLETGDEEDAEQAFESLYQVLYYRWQPASIVGSDTDG
ncbi:MAG: DUF2066 domain-containing protein [Marinobacter sp.]|nr:DUF2066 domain-containing protein [Marinobacter sp.]